MTPASAPKRGSNVGTLITTLIVFACTAACFFSSTLIDMYTDSLWFQSINYSDLFNTYLGTQIGLTIVATLIAAVVLLLNFAFIPYWIAPLAQPVSFLKGKNGAAEIPNAADLLAGSRSQRTLFTTLALIGALILGYMMGTNWMDYLKAAQGVSFNLTDPLFKQDIAFYVFELPWYKIILGWSITLLVLALIGAWIRYSMMNQTRQQRPIAHLSVLGAVLLVFLGIGRLLDQYALLQSELGVVLGAGYTDVNARMPLYIIGAVIFFLIAVLLIINAFTREWKLLLLAGIAWVVVSVIGPVYPILVQNFAVTPNELYLESPYIKQNIAFTRQAYNLNAIEKQPFAGTGTLTQDDLKTNADIIGNIRLWDYRPLQSTYNQIQGIRPYYTFNDVDVDRYTINGKLQSVMLSVRELDVNQLEEKARTWINQHLIYTHGYGLTLSPVTEITPEGLPNLFVRDIPPTSTMPELLITQPGIYFGELTNDYALINTQEKEFDYPQGSANAYTRYTGPDGVQISNIFRRLLLALHLGSSDFFLSPAVTDNSRILFHRNLQDRLQTLAPMLRYDTDPYPIIIDGKILWIIDAYTWSAAYPYSEPDATTEPALNYIRNSVKVTIDAYTGETRFYLIDPQEPIAATYARIFPTLFRPLSEMPAAVREHWRYPETLFQYQARQYGAYHMDDPQVFYNREDRWETPLEQAGEAGQQAQPMEPYYIVTRLPNSDKLEFVLIRPYVPRDKQNMIAWFYANSSGENYGKLGTIELSKDRLIYGPQQIEGRINQDPLISPQLSLWGQRGSRVIWGNMMVIPINNTFLYIEPLYLEAESSRLPELKRVIVVYGDKLAMAPTLNEALLQVITGAAVITPENPQPGTEPPATDLKTQAQQAWEHYQAGQICMQNNDWTCYGQEQAALEQILKAMIEQ